jgi:hypothetical protein
MSILVNCAIAVTKLSPEILLAIHFRAGYSPMGAEIGRGTKCVFAV